MPTKPKYNYDINIIESLQNEGLSLRDIARKMGWPEIGTQAWVNRNFDKQIKYTKKGGIKNVNLNLHF